MKIKHFAGYGCVNAKKIERTENDGLITLKIKVTGNHEWGLYRDDVYDGYNWLLKKFDKKVPSYRNIEDMKIVDSDYEKIDGLDVEVCTYIFTYRY